MTPKPIIHIGIRKAASSYLQNWFSNHSGFSYTTAAGLADKVLELAISGVTLGEVERLNMEPQKIAINRPLECERRLVISNEHFAMNALGSDQFTQEFAENYLSIGAIILKKVFPEAKVLVVTRSPESWIRSAYEQYVRWPHKVKSFKGFLNASWPYLRTNLNYDFIHALYSRIYGAKNVLFIPQELLRDNPDGFLREIEGFSELGGDIKVSKVFKDRPRNVSLGTTNTEKLRYFRTLLRVYFLTTPRPDAQNGMEILLRKTNSTIDEFISDFIACFLYEPNRRIKRIAKLAFDSLPEPPKESRDRTIPNEKLVILGEQSRVLSKFQPYALYDKEYLNTEGGGALSGVSPHVRCLSDSCGKVGSRDSVAFSSRVVPAAKVDLVVGNLHGKSESTLLMENVLAQPKASDEHGFAQTTNEAKEGLADRRSAIPKLTWRIPFFRKENRVRNPLLHVGIRKAASTYLQHAFVNNTGIRLASMEDLEREIFTMVFSSENIEEWLTSVDKKFAPRWNKQFQSGMLDVISNERFAINPRMMKFAKNPNEIDFFYSRFWALTVGALRRLFPEARVLIVTRGAEAWVKSMYSQAIRGAIATHRFPLFLKSHETYLLENLNYFKMGRMFEDAFGSENVLFLPQELLRENPEQFYELLSEFADFPITPARKETIGSAARNASPSYRELDLVLSCWRFIRLFDKYGRKDNSRFYRKYIDGEVEKIERIFKLYYRNAIEFRSMRGERLWNRMLMQLPEPEGWAKSIEIPSELLCRVQENAKFLSQRKGYSMYHEDYGFK